MTIKNSRHIGAIICPNCGKLINANSKACIHCGLKYPGQQNLPNKLLNLINNQIGFSRAVIYVCSGLYLISIIIDPSGLLMSNSIFDLFSPSLEALNKLGMTGSYAISNGRPWTLITAIYLHGSLLHILFNMLWVRQLGPAVQELFGISRLVLIFTLSGVFGFVMSNFMGTGFTIGASGSIFGLLGALIFYGKDRGGFFGRALFRQLISWAIIMMIFGFLSPGIDNWAHAGGFAGGYITAQLSGYTEKRPEKLTHKNIAALCIIVTFICFLLAFWVGFVQRA